MMMKLFLGGLLLAMVFVPAAQTGRNNLSLANPQGGAQWDYRIEKQSWTQADGTRYHIVVNPTNCSWDINDHSEWTARGDLATGASASVTSCHIIDTNPLYACYGGYCADWSGINNSFGASVWSPSDKLLLTVCWQPQNRCWTPAPVWAKDSRQFLYQTCQQAVPDINDPDVVEIPGSGGGLGEREDITVTVSNPTGKRANSIYVSWGLASDMFGPPACPFPHHWSADGYPFRTLVTP